MFGCILIYYLVITVVDLVTVLLGGGGGDEEGGDEGGGDRRRLQAVPFSHPNNYKVTRHLNFVFELATFNIPILGRLFLTNERRSQLEIKTKEFEKQKPKQNAKKSKFRKRAKQRVKI